MRSVTAKKQKAFFMIRLIVDMVMYIFLQYSVVVQRSVWYRLQSVIKSKTKTSFSPQLMMSKVTKTNSYKVNLSGDVISK